MFREGLRPPDPFRPPDPLDAARTQDGMSVRALFALGPTLVVCLPPLGSRRCRAQLRDVAVRRPAIEAGGRRLCLVHDADDAAAHAALAPHDLHYVARVGDPEGALRRALGIEETAPGAVGRVLGARPRPRQAILLVVQGAVQSRATTLAQIASLA